MKAKKIYFSGKQNVYERNDKCHKFLENHGQQIVENLNIGFIKVYLLKNIVAESFVQILCGITFIYPNKSNQFKYKYDSTLIIY